MGQVTDAVVTGFAKSPLLVEQSLAPLRRLRQEGLLRDIHYVTWDSAELDALVAPIQAMSDVRLRRVAQPQASGTPLQKNLIYQIENLKAALALVPEEDAVVLKWRPDYVADAGFLRGKVANFAQACAIGGREALGVPMPAPVFRSKVWIAWADSNQPFFYEDAAFMGRKADLRRLVTQLTQDDLALCDTPACGHYAHIVRFAKVFLSDYPVFGNYLENFRHITNDTEYRVALVPLLLKETFFWLLLLAHAWILHSQFHVDCGEQGDLRFYANMVNRTTDWSKPATWRLTSPYDRVTAWRRGAAPGRVIPCLERPFGRLLDDSWQAALFAGQAPDMPRETLAGLLALVAQSRQAPLKEMEGAFWKRLGDLHHTHFRPAFAGALAGQTARFPGNPALRPVLPGAGTPAM